MKLVYCFIYFIIMSIAHFYSVHLFLLWDPFFCLFMHFVLSFYCVRVCSQMSLSNSSLLVLRWLCTAIGICAAPKPLVGQNWKWWRYSRLNETMKGTEVRKERWRCIHLRNKLKIVWKDIWGQLKLAETCYLCSCQPLGVLDGSFSWYSDWPRAIFV